MTARRPTVLFIALLFVIVSLVVASSFLLIRVSVRASDAARPKGGESYDWHLMMVGKRADSPFWQEVYAGARKAGEEGGAIVEFTGPASDADVTSLDGYVDYAIAARVDGILTYASDSVLTDETLARAAERGIPVITLENDAVASARQSFVGVSSFELGKILGELVYRAAGTQAKAILLLGEGSARSSDTILLSGLQEAISPYPSIRVSPFATGGKTGNEEMLRGEILNDRDLDVIVSLNVEDTMRVAQAVIELNKGDTVSIVAFRESPEILEYVRKGVVSACVAIDAAQMGAKAVGAMLEFLETGHANDYAITDMHVITRSTMEGGKK